LVLSRNCPPVKILDRVLQRWRIAKAAPHIPDGARVLDVGCADGALFRALRKRIAGGVGIDPDLPAGVAIDGAQFVRGFFPRDLQNADKFDVITMLAVFEHLDEETQPIAVAACGRLLRSSGLLVLSVPEPAVDRIVHTLVRLRLVAGMALHEHHGFEASRTPAIVTAGPFELVRHDRFQLGLNNLFVFRRR
jgi:2-polyprenyl-3-methyl-5-hydroxy-6-metoxy-1,4-benzoquinol methylase